MHCDCNYDNDKKQDTKLFILFCQIFWALHFFLVCLLDFYPQMGNSTTCIAMVYAVFSLENLILVYYDL